MYLEGNVISILQIVRKSGFQKTNHVKYLGLLNIIELNCIL